MGHNSIGSRKDDARDHAELGSSEIWTAQKHLFVGKHEERPTPTQVNAQGLLREVQAAEEGLEATSYRKGAELPVHCPNCRALLGKQQIYLYFPWHS